MAAAPGTEGVEFKHPDLPSYGLEREQCSSCKESPKSDKDSLSTLAQERHEKLLKKIITDNSELLKIMLNKYGNRNSEI